MKYLQRNIMLKNLNLLLVLALFVSSCSTKRVEKTSGAMVQHGHLLLEFDSVMHAKVNSNFDTLPLSNDFLASEYLILDHTEVKDFNLIAVEKIDITSKLGNGNRLTLIGEVKNEKMQLSKIVTVETFDDFEDIATVEVAYINNGKNDLSVAGWVNNNYAINSNSDNPPFWSFQSGSYEERPDWVLPLKDGFEQENYMGMNASDYGGGTPVVDIWRKDVGIAVGHMEMVPKLVSLPVQVDDTKATIAIQFKKQLQLSSGDTLNTFKTFVSIHQGDYFSTLEKYTKMMQLNGLKFVASEAAAYESIWCAWGYERNFNVEEILNTLPKVKELGIKWAVLDDGFQIAEGDWNVNRDKFPKGDSSMIEFVDEIHSYGLKAKLWWTPLAVDSGTQLLADHPDILLINRHDSVQKISWWDSYYMSPTEKEAIAHTKDVVTMFLGKWGFDGLKMDGQHLNGIPPDYNPAHKLEYPEQSVEGLPDFFNMIYKTARKIKPHAVIENCPCGTACSFYNMAYMNQAVSSDPLSSWQIRLKGKTYKALMGKTAYYGDHVELSDNASDFASSFGVGAVLGTKFTWPKDNPTQSESFLLTPEKEVEWKKWFGLYNEKMLSKEEYLGQLYDIGYDVPETHVIKKDEVLHYAFYAKVHEGIVELRGLENRTYQINDYVNGISYGEVKGPTAEIDAKFTQYLLIEAVPTKK